MLWIRPLPHPVHHVFTFCSYCPFQAHVKGSLRTHMILFKLGQVLMEFSSPQKAMHSSNTLLRIICNILSNLAVPMGTRHCVIILFITCKMSLQFTKPIISHLLIFLCCTSVYVLCHQSICCALRLCDVPLVYVLYHQSTQTIYDYLLHKKHYCGHAEVC